ncbi:hypothetical protein BJ165DRAFT_1355421 [Panaeolus papilionaceus]|nr:hypothetical protein BJ165DRAFT_1355421 [Panaeolus papilionaceus]
MGPTGAGKSTVRIFIALGHVDIGDTLESCTTEIGVTRVSVPGGGTTTNIVLVDTPGFEDTHKSDRVVFKMIAQWLEETFIQQIPVSGVVYLHKISDNRMGGTALSNLSMFQKICGVDAFKRIVFTTTMWGEVDSEQQGIEREIQLVKNYWKAMMDKGARTMRFQGDRDSALGIIRPLIEEAADVRPLRLQAELTQLYKDLPETDAGRKMYSKLEALLKEQNEVMSKLQQELGKGWSPQEKSQLEEQIADLSTQIKTVVVDMQYMKLPLSARFYRLLHRS